MNWKIKLMSPTSLHLDTKNPRLGREHSARAPREILQYLFEHDKAMEVAESIVTRGFFPNEPLLAVMENGRLVVVEGNRRWYNEGVQTLRILVVKVPRPTEKTRLL